MMMRRFTDVADFEKASHLLLEPRASRICCERCASIGHAMSGIIFVIRYFEFLASRMAA